MNKLIIIFLASSRSTGLRLFGAPSQNISTDSRFAQETIRTWGKKCKTPKCVRKGCAENVAKDECCNSHMFRMLNKVSSFLTLHNHTHGLIFGSLIGAVRSQGVIPWTADVDLFISYDARKSLLGNPIPGIHFWQDHIPALRACVAEEGNPESRWPGGGKVSSSPQSPHYYMDLYSPTAFHLMKKCDRSFSGREKIFGTFFPAPANSDECLRSLYGNYKNPSHRNKNDVASYRRPENELEFDDASLRIELEKWKAEAEIA